MDVASLQQELESLQFCRGLAPSAIKKIAASASVREAPAGEVLFREGELHTHSYLVHTGLVGIEVHGPPHGTMRLITLGPGDLVGWSPFFGQSPMSARATCVTDAQLIALDVKKLLTAFHEDPCLGYEVMRQVAAALARRLVATRIQLLDVYRAEPPQITEPTDVD